MKQNLIWDLDGTLANGDHRQHLIDQYPRKWDEYYEIAHLDSVHEPMVVLYRDLLNCGYYNHIISGRRVDTKDKTIQWLHEHGLFFSSLSMREVSDFTQDDVLKLQMAARLHLTPANTLLVFEDRTRCVDAWRRSGFKCLQVAMGDF